VKKPFNNNRLEFLLKRVSHFFGCRKRRYIGRILPPDGFLAGKFAASGAIAQQWLTSDKQSIMRQLLLATY
jgi:hypothetical protein